MKTVMMIGVAMLIGPALAWADVPTTQPTTRPEALSGEVQSMFFGTGDLQTNGCVLNGRLGGSMFSPGLPIATCTVTPNVAVTVRFQQTASSPPVATGPTALPAGGGTRAPASGWLPARSGPDLLTSLLAQTPPQSRLGPLVTVPGGSARTTRGVQAVGPIYPTQNARPYYTPLPFGWVGNSQFSTAAPNNNFRVGGGVVRAQREGRD